MKRLLLYIGSYLLMGLLMIVLAVAMGFATFFEKYYGLEASWGLVYSAWWFNLLWLLLAINLVAALFTRARFARKRLGIFIFHLAFLIIITGAGITRFFGTAGLMHLREAEARSTYMSEEPYLQVADSAGHVLFSSQDNFNPYSSNEFSEAIQTQAGVVELNLTRYIPNSVPVLIPDKQGVPVLKLVVATLNGRVNQLLALGEIIQVDGITIGYECAQVCDIVFKGADSLLTLTTSESVLMGSMPSSHGSDVVANTPSPVKLNTIYAGSKYQLVVTGIAAPSRVEYMPQGKSNAQTLEFRATFDGLLKTIYLNKSNELTDWTTINLGGQSLLMRYGPKEVKLPFSVVLNKFVLERYSGSESPSAYSSLIAISDESGGVFERSVAMNRVVDYHGYRFFQASYDTDEKGTILRVSNDFWGMTLTYLGYGLFMVGVLFMMISRRTKLYALLTSPSAKVGVILAFILMPAFSMAQELPVPDRDHAAKFGRLLVLSRDGRIHPLNTISGEITRKVTGQGTYGDLSSDQLVLAMTVFPDFYQAAPIIKLGNDELRNLLGVEKSLASFLNFFDSTTGGYKLQQQIAAINQKPPVSRTKMEKEILKVDERVNICYMIFTGGLLKLFPDANTGQWLSIEQGLGNGGDSTQAGRLLLEYFTALRFATSTGSYQNVDSTLNRFAVYQNSAAGSSFDGFPALEVLYNKIKPFERIIPIYGLAGFFLLILLFFQRSWRHAKLTSRILVGIVVAGFVVHTAGLGLRWVIAGHSPMSNGYESMLMVSWVALLAGLLLVRKMPTILGIAAILATATLFVAHLSWMDPEITNLVPVLKSKWLTLHVSFVMAGYAFFGLAAFLGFLSLLVIAIPKLYRRIEGDDFGRIQNIMQAGMIIGLYLFTVGTFLGAIWANESWGRYWGWDPKETWALITILVYVIITHLDNIPGFKNPIAVSFSSLVGFVTVLMTYFGVNYLLSGLHSYASGEAVRIPWGVYAGIGLVLVVWVAAIIGSRYSIFRKPSEVEK